MIHMIKNLKFGKEALYVSMTALALMGFGVTSATLAQVATSALTANAADTAVESSTYANKLDSVKAIKRSDSATVSGNYTHKGNAKQQGKYVGLLP